MNRSAAGFSLLEVLVALAVIGIGLSAALSITSHTIDSVGEVEKRVYGHWVADNQIAELKLKGPAAPGALEGDAVMAGRNFQWRATITATEDEDVLQCRLRVFESSDTDQVLADVIAFLQAVEA